MGNFADEMALRIGKFAGNCPDIWLRMQLSFVCLSKVREMDLSLKKMNVDGVIFELEGTILDSIGIYYQIIQTVFQHFGMPMP